MKRLGVVLATLFFVSTVTSLWAAQKTPHTYSEIKGYLVQVKEIQNEGNEIFAETQNKKIPAGQAIKQTKKAIEKLKKISEPWEFQQHKELLMKYYGKKLEQYEVLEKTGSIPAGMSQSAHELAMDVYNAMISAMKLLKPEEKKINS